MPLSEEREMSGAAGVVYSGTLFDSPGFGALTCRWLVHSWDGNGTICVAPGPTAARLTRANQTVSVLSAWLLAMVLHPEVYKRAQVQLDTVVGNDRLPELDDRPELPYLECILKEVYR